MFSEKVRQQLAIVDFIERTLDRCPGKQHVTMTELGKYVDKLVVFANSKDGPRQARQVALDDLVRRGVLNVTSVHTAGRPTQLVSFACVGWELEICAVKSYG